MSTENFKQATVLNANQVMNAVYHSKLLFSILGFRNKSLLERKKEPMDLKEYEVFLRIFFGLCFYTCSLLDVLKHPVSYPLLIALKKLRSHHQPLESKIVRMNDLLQSFEGQTATSHQRRLKTLKVVCFGNQCLGLTESWRNCFMM